MNNENDENNENKINNKKEENKCISCGKSFSTKSNLKRHFIICQKKIFFK